MKQDKKRHDRTRRNGIERDGTEKNEMRIMSTSKYYLITICILLKYKFVILKKILTILVITTLNSARTFPSFELRLKADSETYLYLQQILAKEKKKFSKRINYIMKLCGARIKCLDFYIDSD